MTHHTYRVLTGLLIATIVVGCAAKSTNPSLARIRELDRSRRWKDSAEMIQQFLDSGLAASDSEKCEVLYYLVYAYIGMENTEAAKASLDQFSHQCPNLPGVKDQLSLDINTMIPSSEQ